MSSEGRKWALILVLFMVLLIQGITASDEDIPKPVTSIFPDSAAITSFSPGGQYIMLTFDSTPHSKHLDKVLDALRSKNASATFFLYGTKSVHHTHLIQRMIAEGHEVGCRGWNGKPFPTMQPDALLTQLRETRETLFKITGVYPKLVRPPRGMTNRNITNMIETETGMKTILWNFEPARVDGKMPKTVNGVTGDDFVPLNPRLILQNVVDFALPGDIMYFHDGQTNIIAVLPQIISALRMNGHELLTVSEMLSFPDDKPH